MGSWGSRIVPYFHPIAAFLTARVLASAAALIGSASIPANPTISAGGYSKPVYSRFMELVFGVWEKSDALWYLHLARDGYGTSSAEAAFFPLYPLLIRILEWMTGLPPIVAAIAISNAAFLGALILLHSMFRADLGPEPAKRALWLIALFPGSFFFLAPYTESLFLFLSVAAFFCARTGRWWLAGACGAALGLTRNLGVLILVPLLFEVFRQRKGLVRVFLVPSGLLAWCIYCYFKWGDPIAFVRAQSNWGREASFPLTTIWTGIEQAWQFAATAPGGVYILEAFAVLFACVAAVAAWVHLPRSYAAWIWMLLVPPLCAAYPGRVLLSSLRFVAVIFPVFASWSLLPRQELWDGPLRLVFAGLYGLAVALYVANQNLF